MLKWGHFSFGFWKLKIVLAFVTSHKKFTHLLRGGNAPFLLFDMAFARNMRYTNVAYVLTIRIRLLNRMFIVFIDTQNFNFRNYKYAELTLMIWRPSSLIRLMVSLHFFIVLEAILQIKHSCWSVEDWRDSEKKRNKKWPGVV